MVKIQNLIATIVHNGYYDFKTVVKIAYMMDWKHSVVYGSQMTDANWFVNDTNNLSINVDFEFSNNIFSIKNGKISTELIPVPLTGNELFIFNDIIMTIEKKIDSSISDFVYSSYPFQSNPISKYLDLSNLASEYKNTKY